MLMWLDFQGYLGKIEQHVPKQQAISLVHEFHPNKKSYLFSTASVITKNQVNLVIYYF